MEEDKQNLISEEPDPEVEHEDEPEPLEASNSSRLPYSTTTTTALEDDEEEESVPKITLITKDTTDHNHSTNSFPLINPIKNSNSNNRSKFPLKRPSICTKRFVQNWKFHWRVFVSAFLTIFSAMGTIILFPIYLKAMTSSVQYNSNSASAAIAGGTRTPFPAEAQLEIEEEEEEISTTDGYSACFAITTISLFLMLIFGLILKGVYWNSKRRIIIFKPMISFLAIFKIGLCNGLCILTIFYAWEDHKVLCNLQDPFLGLVFLFAVITYAVGKWKEIGYRRSFALVTICAGVFISVDYTIVDHYKCRGYYYYYYPYHPSIKDPWSWQVHFVWTLAFVVAIWLWTVAIFSLQSTIPNLEKHHSHHHRQRFSRSRDGRIGDYNPVAVRMKVIRINSNNNSQAQAAAAEESNSEHHHHKDKEYDPSSTTNSASMRLANNNSPQFYNSILYYRITYLRVFNATLWFHIATWIVILSLCWTEFIPGFGKGPITINSLPNVLIIGFKNCISIHTIYSWSLILAILLFSQSFTYLLLLIGSPLISIGILCIAFPLVSIWWSFFQWNHNILIWTPMISGELFCGFLGIPLIAGGIVYLFRLDILKVDMNYNAISAINSIV